MNAIIGIDISLQPMLQSLKPQDLIKPAFTPSLSKITLQVGPGAWSRLIQNTAGITVQDVLTGIYGLYYAPLDPSETYNIPRDVMTSAKQWAGPRADGRLQRVDLLCGHTKVMAIQLSPDRSSCFIYMR